MQRLKTRKEYLALVEELIQHDQSYYDKTFPTISDFEYDQKMKAVLRFEQEHPESIDPNSPTQRVSEAPTAGFVQREHITPMISLANSYSAEEISDFLQRVEKLLRKKSNYCCELKMDGAALSLQYEKGVFIRALTRGNGRKGDDVTANIKTIRALPLSLKGPFIPDFMEIRAEVYMSLATFQALNETREEEGLEPFANPRNAAAGSLKLLDPKEVAKRKLQIICYGITEGLYPVETQMELHPLLKKWGLPVAAKEHIRFCSDLEDILEFARNIEEERRRLPFEIDGIVIKVNDLKFHPLLGSTGKVPRFAIAYKFAPEQAKTQVLQITVQVGRTGVLTPVAELQPVFLAGSTISRATLHNQEEIARKDIRVHDHVIIEKGGDVIPKVVAVEINKRPPHTQRWTSPTHCPICATPVIHLPEEVAIRCPNPHCPAQLERKITYFASKHALDIDHMGEKVVHQLIEKKLIRRPSDIYSLDENKLSQLDSFKEKSIHNLLKSIDASRHCSLARFIMALQIRSVGVETAELLAEEAKDLSTLLNMSQSDFLQIDGIGDKTALLLADFFVDPKNLEEIERLISLGVNPLPLKAKMKGHPFEGKVFVLTGTLSRHTREEASRLIKERGGKISNSVSSSTDFLLLGDDPGSKYDKAKKLGVALLSEEAFEAAL